MPVIWSAHFHRHVTDWEHAIAWNTILTIDRTHMPVTYTVPCPCTYRLYLVLKKLKCPWPVLEPHRNCIAFLRPRLNTLYKMHFYTFRSCCDLIWCYIVNAARLGLTCKIFLSYIISNGLMISMHWLFFTVTVQYNEELLIKNVACTVTSEKVVLQYFQDLLCNWILSTEYCVFYLKTIALLKVAHITMVLSAQVFSILAAVRSNVIMDCLHSIHIKVKRVCCCCLVVLPLLTITLCFLHISSISLLRRINTDSDFSIRRTICKHQRHCSIRAAALCHKTITDCAEKHSSILVVWREPNVLQLVLFFFI